MRPRITRLPPAAPDYGAAGANNTNGNSNRDREQDRWNAISERVGKTQTPQAHMLYVGESVSLHEP